VLLTVICPEQRLVGAGAVHIIDCQSSTLSASHQNIETRKSAMQNKHSRQELEHCGIYLK